MNQVGQFQRPTAKLELKAGEICVSFMMNLSCRSVKLDFVKLARESDDR